MTINVINCATQVASFLKVPIGKVSINNNGLLVRTVNNSTTTGFIGIILQLLKESNTTLSAKAVEDEAELRQWLEYALTNFLHSDALQGNTTNQILKEMNAIFSSRTYLISHNFGVADVVFFYILYPFMNKLSYLDKEKYINISRWFDHLQQDSILRQKNKMVDFSTNYLTAVAPIKH